MQLYASRERSGLNVDYGIYVIVFRISTDISYSEQPDKVILAGWIICVRPEQS